MFMYMKTKKNGLQIWLSHFSCEEGGKVVCYKQSKNIWFLEYWIPVLSELHFRRETIVIFRGKQFNNQVFSFGLNKVQFDYYYILADKCKIVKGLKSQYHFKQILISQ